MNNPHQNIEASVNTANTWDRPSQNHGFLSWIPPAWSGTPFGVAASPSVESWSWTSHNAPEHEFNTSSRYNYFPLGHLSGELAAVHGSGIFAESQHDKLLGYSQRYENAEENDGLKPRSSTGDETDMQRCRDIWWVRRLTDGKRKHPCALSTRYKRSRRILLHKDTMFAAAEIISKLQHICRFLRDNVQNSSGWENSYVTTLQFKTELQKMGHDLLQLKTKIRLDSRQRSRRIRALSAEEVRLRSDREAAIDARRMKQMRQVEEILKEKEMKKAADSVLCEVRKKQADVKRMQDVLRSLEKLRKLRKEAASRKGIISPLLSDESFTSGLEHLKYMLKRRTTIYDTEETALMVMLEGEQEEERKREWEKKVKKETGKQLDRKCKVESMLFGDQCPVDAALQSLTHYYTQGQHSLLVLIEIRRKWDMYSVPEDHPDGSSVPQSWILPSTPSDLAWASTLQNADLL